MGDRFKKLLSGLKGKGPVEYEDEKKTLSETKTEEDELAPKPEKKLMVVKFEPDDKEIPGDELLDSESLKIREEKERQEMKARSKRPEIESEEEDRLLNDDELKEYDESQKKEAKRRVFKSLIKKDKSSRLEED